MWEMNKEEIAFYGQMFDLADVSKTGKVEGKTAVEFFTKSGLPAIVLKEVWTLASSNKQPYLNQEEFNVALGLIALAQRGESLDLSRLVALTKSRSLPLPVLNIQGARDFVMSASDEEKYKSLFRDAIGDLHGTMASSIAKDLFQKSSLGDSEIQDIYRLVDSPLNNGIRIEGFVIAMHLIVCKTRRGMNQIPSKIPMELFPTLVLPQIELEIISRETSANSMLEKQLTVQKKLRDAIDRIPSVDAGLESQLNSVEALGFKIPPSPQRANLDNNLLQELESVLQGHISQVQQDIQILQKESPDSFVSVQTLLQTLANLKQQSTRLIEQKESLLRNRQHPNLHIDVKSQVGGRSVESASFDAPTLGLKGQDSFAPIVPSAAPSSIPDLGFGLFSPPSSGTNNSFPFDGASGGTGGSSNVEAIYHQPIEGASKTLISMDAFATAESSTFDAFEARNEMDLGIGEKFQAIDLNTPSDNTIEIENDSVVDRNGAGNIKLPRKQSIVSSEPSLKQSDQSIGNFTSFATPSSIVKAEENSTSFGDFVAPDSFNAAGFSAFGSDAPSTATFDSNFGQESFGNGFAAFTTDSANDFGHFEASNTVSASQDALGTSDTSFGTFEATSFGDFDSKDFGSSFGMSNNDGFETFQAVTDLKQDESSFNAFQFDHASSTAFTSELNETPNNASGFGDFASDFSQSTNPASDATGFGAFSSDFSTPAIATSEFSGFGDFASDFSQPANAVSDASGFEIATSDFSQPASGASSIGAFESVPTTIASGDFSSDIKQEENLAAFESERSNDAKTSSEEAVSNGSGFIAFGNETKFEDGFVSTQVDGSCTTRSNDEPLPSQDKYTMNEGNDLQMNESNDHVIPETTINTSNDFSEFESTNSFDGRSASWESSENTTIDIKSDSVSFDKSFTSSFESFQPSETFATTNMDTFGNFEPFQPNPSDPIPPAPLADTTSIEFDSAFHIPPSIPSKSISTTSFHSSNITYQSNSSPFQDDIFGNIETKHFSSEKNIEKKNEINFSSLPNQKKN